MQAYYNIFDGLPQDDHEFQAAYLPNNYSLSVQPDVKKEHEEKENSNKIFSKRQIKKKNYDSDQYSFQFSTDIENYEGDLYDESLYSDLYMDFDKSCSCSYYNNQQNIQHPPFRPAGPIINKHKHKVQQFYHNQKAKQARKKEYYDFYVKPMQQHPEYWVVKKINNFKENVEDYECYYCLKEYLEKNKKKHKYLKAKSMGKSRREYLKTQQMLDQNANMRYRLQDAMNILEVQKHEKSKQELEIQERYEILKENMDELKKTTQFIKRTLKVNPKEHEYAWGVDQQFIKEQQNKILERQAEQQQDKYYLKEELDTNLNEFWKEEVEQRTIQTRRKRIQEFKENQVVQSMSKQDKKLLQKNKNIQLRYRQKAEALKYQRQNKPQIYLSANHGQKIGNLLEQTQMEFERNLQKTKRIEKDKILEKERIFWKYSGINDKKSFKKAKPLPKVPHKFAEKYQKQKIKAEQFFEKIEEIQSDLEDEEDKNAEIKIHQQLVEDLIHDKLYEQFKKTMEVPQQKIEGLKYEDIQKAVVGKNYKMARNHEKIRKQQQKIKKMKKQFNNLKERVDIARLHQRIDYDQKQFLESDQIIEESEISEISGIHTDGQFLRKDQKIAILEERILEKSKKSKKRKFKKKKGQKKNRKSSSKTAKIKKQLKEESQQLKRILKAADVETDEEIRCMSQKQTKKSWKTATRVNQAVKKQRENARQYQRTGLDKAFLMKKQKGKTKGKGKNEILVVENEEEQDFRAQSPQNYDPIDKLYGYIDKDIMGKEGFDAIFSQDFDDLVRKKQLSLY